MVGNGQMPRRNVLLAVGAVTALLSVSGCSLFEAPEKVGMADLTGVWHSENPENHVTTLTLSADGTSEWSGVPDGVFSASWSSELKWDTLTTYQGTWTVEKDSGNNMSFAELDFTRPVNYGGLSFYVEGQGSDRTLKYAIGDPDMDDDIVFRR